MVTGAEMDRIELHAVGLADALLSGPVSSLFRGEGMEPAGTRPYVAGDDVRALDWRATARTGRLHVRERLEERDLEVRLVVDRSASLHGSLAAEPGRAALDVAAGLAAGALRRGRRVGLLQFTDLAEDEVPPGAGRAHLRRILSALHGLTPAGRGTALAAVLNGVAARPAARSTVVVVSDFQVPLPEREHALSAMARVARRHDFLPVRIRLPGPERIGRVGAVRLADPETGKLRVVDTSNEEVRRTLARAAEEREAWWRGVVAALALTPVDVSPGEPLAPQVAAAVALRRRRGT